VIRRSLMRTYKVVWPLSGFGYIAGKIIINAIKKYVYRKGHNFQHTSVLPISITNENTVPGAAIRLAYISRPGDRSAAHNRCWIPRRTSNYLSTRKCRFYIHEYLLHM